MKDAVRDAIAGLSLHDLRFTLQQKINGLIEGSDLAKKVVEILAKEVTEYQDDLVEAAVASIRSNLKAAAAAVGRAMVEKMLYGLYLPAPASYSVTEMDAMKRAIEAVHPIPEEENQCP